MVDRESQQLPQRRWRIKLDPDHGSELPESELVEKLLAHAPMVDEIELGLMLEHREAFTDIGDADKDVILDEPVQLGVPALDDLAPELGDRRQLARRLYDSSSADGLRRARAVWF